MKSPARTDTPMTQPTDGSTWRPYASFRRRLGAMLLDGVIVFGSSVVIFFVAALASIVVPFSFYSVFAASPFLLVGYFAWCWRRGGSPGMSAAHIQLLDADTGGLPRSGRMVVRGIIAAFYYLFSFWFVYRFATLLVYLGMVLSLGQPSEEKELTASDFLSAGSFVTLGLFLAITVANLWMLWDPRRQTLIDKLCRVVVVQNPRPERTVSKERPRLPDAPRQPRNEPTGSPA